MTLTPRQMEIAGLVAQGLSSKAIASETGLSVDTVNDHIKNAAVRIPGSGRPRMKLAIWFFVLEAEITS